MRIIGGRFGGRKLVSFQGDHLRPTSDRVKESLFNMLGQNLNGLDVLDLFSGTGSLSIEAFSRGASRVVAVEKNPKSLDILRKNLKTLNIEGHIQVVRSDVMGFLKKYRGQPFDIVLVDPPFTEKMADSVMSVLATSGVWVRGTIVAIESSDHELIKDQYLDLDRSDSRDFGDKRLSFFRVK